MLWWHLMGLTSFNSTQFSVAQSCPTLCSPMDCNTPGFPVHHQLPEHAQNHVLESVMASNRLILCHPFSCPQSFPTSGSFPVSQFFTSDGQIIGVSASASVLPTNIQDWFPLGLIGLISLGVDLQGTPTPQFKSINSSALSFLYSPTLISILDYWKNHSSD